MTKEKKKPRLQVYYAHPYRSGERGSNEKCKQINKKIYTKKEQL